MKNIILFVIGVTIGFAIEFAVATKVVTKLENDMAMIQRDADSKVDYVKVQCRTLLGMQE